MNPDIAALKALVKLMKAAEARPSPDTTPVSDAEYKLVCGFSKYLPILERLIEQSNNGMVLIPKDAPDRIISLMRDAFGKHGQLQNDAGYQVQAWGWMKELYALVVAAEGEAALSRLLEAQAEWVKCSERMPPSWERVLCYGPGLLAHVTSGIYFEDQVNSERSEWHIGELYWKRDEVTYWMPLLHPPSEGEMK